MRASLYLIGFAAASIVGAGVAEIGCSSSSSGSPPTPVEDAATDTGTTPPVDSGTTPEAAACVPNGVISNTETFDSGSAAWACEQAMCSSQLTACAADCDCNNAMATALLCAAADASSAYVMTCFVNSLDALAMSSPAGAAAEGPVGLCLQMTTQACNPTGPTDGGHDGGATEAGPVDAGGGG